MIGEVMTNFLCGQSDAFKGVMLPPDGEDLLDQEFVDDTMLFVQYTLESLEAVYIALETLCSASGACVNWHKTIGLLVGYEEQPSQRFAEGFTWL